MGRRERSWPAAAAVVLFGGCVVWGSLLNVHGAGLQLGAPPLAGHWDLRLGVRVVLPVAVAAAVWVLAPRAQRLGWPLLLAAGFTAELVWAVSLALIDGAAGLRGPLESPDEALHDVSRVHGLGSLLSTFTDSINTYGRPGAWTTHVAGHPPGLFLVVAGLRAVGLPGPWPLVVLLLVLGCSSVVAALVTTRAVAGEPAARAAAPFLALPPAVVWLAVSDDAAYLGVLAWGVALLALAGRRRSVPLGAAAGVVLGAALFLTYGALPLGLLALAVVRRLRPLLAAALGVVAVAALFAAGGFWWPTGLHETLVRVHAGAGGSRPQSYFLVADVAALLVALGPAVPVGLRLLRRHDPLCRLVVPTLVALLCADLSGTSRGEVERVWLPFLPWLLVATARLQHPRRWLAAQLVTGLAVQVGLRSKW